MKKILYVKGSAIDDVRLRKSILFFLRQKDYRVEFIGWDRARDNQLIDNIDIKYIHKGGTMNKKILVLNYLLWILKLFFKLLFMKGLKDRIVIAVNFDAAFPVYFVSKFKNINYLYEIHDEIALSYNFGKGLKDVVRRIDKRICENANKVIHVDENRCDVNNSHNVIIENSPYDFFSGKDRSYDKVQHKFAVIGYFSDVRCIDQIYLFAKNNPQLTFMLAGKGMNSELESKFKKLSNAEFYDFMPQEILFSLMLECCAIFSLYEPSIEINKLAASNKVYDAMMLGIPVITNPEVVNSKFILDNNIGLVVNCVYDSSWSILASTNFVDHSISIGKKGRSLYLKYYEFDKLMEKRLLPILDSVY